uniref:Uncharacterized protein n=1 Tax=Salix viminalis TaxID=40686 RepID=A0A6N2M8K8_SALVM
MRNKDTRAEKRIVGTRAEKRPVVARTEKRAANGSNYNANSNQNQTMTRLSAKGKEKINSSREDSKFVTREKKRCSMDVERNMSITGGEQRNLNKKIHRVK